MANSAKKVTSLNTELGRDMQSSAIRQYFHYMDTRDRNNVKGMVNSETLQNSKEVICLFTFR